MTAKSTPESFWVKVNIRQPHECWEWLGCCNNTGYGSFRWLGKNYTAHRVAAWLSGLVDTPAAPKNRKGSGFILHSCDNRKCCNPSHFTVGTYSKNQRHAYNRQRRRASKGETHANAKLTNDQAENIRKLYATGNYRQVDIAEMYGVSQRVISLITRNKAYTS